jgi:hypothetical protein
MGRDGLGAELGRLISEASAALTHLDAETLEALNRKAATLQGMALGGLGSKGFAGAAELEARVRVFAAMVKASRENLTILERAGSQKTLSQKQYGQHAFGIEHELAFPDKTPAAGLFQSFGLYNDADAGGSIWPPPGSGRPARIDAARSRWRT